MEMTLLLNSTYEPLRVLHWQKAITLLWQGKVEVLEVYDRQIHGISISIKLPSVMRLLKLVKLKDSHRAVKFSRINIFTRDGYCCQYCKHKFRTEELTFDHVVPIAKGGRKTWENIVTACWRCNNRKSGRTPGRSQHAFDQEARKAALESHRHDYHRDPEHAGKLAGLSVLEPRAGRGPG
jgi:5-methylcytosine-specific restriction endonuclease McrA